MSIIPKRISLRRVPDPSIPASGQIDAPTALRILDAIRACQVNFQTLEQKIVELSLDGGLGAGGTITLDQLAASVKQLTGDVTGTIGATGATVVERIRGADVPDPTASEDDHLLRYDHGTGALTWQTIEELIDDILTTSGDLLYRSGSSITRLGVGSAYSILAVNAGGTAPAYATLSALLDAAIGNTQGNVLIRDGSGWTVLAPGTSGQVLTTNGAGADPSWEDASGGGGTPGVDFDILTDEDGLILDDGQAIWT